MTHWQGAEYFVGIDEVGRGPIAGPLLVAGVITSKKNKKEVERRLYSIRDSKKLSEKQREMWYGKLYEMKSEGLLTWRISFVTARVIDRDGVARALRVTVARVLAHLKAQPNKTGVLLDGSLHAPRQFTKQKTIVRGEEKEKLIAAASVVAKVLRDRRMRNYAERFPKYNFDIHKGYGTQEHMRVVQQHGLCPLHRRTFIH